MSKLKGVPLMLLPSRPRRRASRRQLVSRADGQRILGAHVDVALARAHGVGGDGHAFDHAVGIAFQDAAVHERAGVALVAVADHVLHVAAGLGYHAPLQAGGITAAAATTQAALGDLLDHAVWASSRPTR